MLAAVTAVGLLGYSMWQRPKAEVNEKPPSPAASPVKAEPVETAVEEVKVKKNAGRLPDSKTRDTAAIWAEFGTLAAKYNCTNLTFGAPGYAPP